METELDNKLIDQFEDDIKAGESPEIDRYLSGVPDESKQRILLELISIEIFHNVKKGRSVSNSDYSRFGQDAVDHADRIRDELSNLDKAKGSECDTLGGSVLDTAVAGEVSQPSSSQVIGPYTLIKQLGIGGMGTVWLAEQEKPVKRRVALKLIKSEVASKEILARFDAEKQALAMMSHPNIARVIDAGTTEQSRPYFVMEWVDGIPLTQFCDDNKLGVNERLTLLIAVCKAVQHAHQKGIIHRDLKPSNVLVTFVDGEAVPKVIDFGLAKAVEHHMQLTDATILTEFGMVVGTVQYMSPEQAELKAVDAGDVDTRTDVYSLGVMLYELLTGTTPLTKEILGRSALFKVLEIIREKDPPRPSNRLSSISNEVNTDVCNQRSTQMARLQQLLKGDLDWVVMKALEKERSRRYQTANDLAQDLSNYLSGEAVSARPPSTWYQLQKFANRNRGLVAAMLAIAVVLLGGIAGTTFGLIRANQKTKLAEQEKRRARDSEAVSKFQLANARWEANRAWEARNLLYEIPVEYRDNFEWHFCNRHFLGSDITCYGHEKAIYGVAYSPDGEHVASASADDTIKVFNARNGAEIFSFAGHTKTATEVAFSPDGKRLASCAIDNTVRVWDVQSGQEIATLSGHSNWVMDVVFSPDGTLIASASDDNTIRLWDVSTFKEIKTLKGHTREVQSVVFSPDGSQLVSCSVDATVKLWDPGTGQEIATLIGHNARVIDVAFSPDGTRIASASNNHILIWNAKTFQQINKLQGHTSWVNSVAFSPDGRWLASASLSTTIKLWDAWTGQEIASLTGHAGGVNGVEFSPDGSRLVSGSDDATVKLWDMKSAEEIISLNGHTSWVRSLAFNPDGTRLVSAGTDRTIRLWDPQTGDQLSSFNGHAGDITCVVFSPDGSQLASASRDNSIKLWDPNSGKEFATLNGHADEVQCVAFSPDSSRLASASDDRKVKIWNALSGKEIATLDGHKQWVSAVVFSPDGAVLASGGWDAAIKLWDSQTLQEITTLECRSEAILSLAFSPDGEHLASGCYEGTIRLWHVATGEEVATLNGHIGAVYSLAFSPDGGRIVSASGDETVRLWCTSSAREVTTFNLHNDRVYSVAFSPNGTRIASSGRDKIIKLLEARKDLEIISLKGHTASVTSVTFSDNGKHLLSNSANEEIVWDVASKQQVADANWAPPSSPQRVSSDGRWLATREENDVVLVDLEYKQNPREKAYRNAKTKFDQIWHRQQANEASSTQNWFAATFHFAWLITNAPDQAEFYDGLKSSYRKLVDSFDSDENDIDSGLPSVVKNALKLPRGRFVNETDESFVINEEKLHLQRDLIERYRRGVFLQAMALADYRSGNYSQAIRQAFKSVATLAKGDSKYSSPLAGGYAILAMSHFKSGNMDQANDYRKRFEEAMKSKSNSDDTNSKQLAQELNDLFAGEIRGSKATGAVE